MKCYLKLILGYVTGTTLLFSHITFYNVNLCYLLYLFIIEIKLFCNPYISLQKKTLELVKSSTLNINYFIEKLFMCNIA